MDEGEALLARALGRDGASTANRARETLDERVADDDGVAHADRRDGRWRRSTYALATCAVTMAVVVGMLAVGRAVGRARAVSETETRTATRARLGARARRGGGGALGRATKDAVFLTYSDRVVPGMCVSGETAAMSGIALRMLGSNARDSARFDVERVKNPKTKKVFAWLKALTDDDMRKELGIGDDTIVSLGDASDVMYVQNVEEVLRHFKDIELESGGATKNLVVVSSDKNCWPWVIKGRERIPGGFEACEKYPRDVGSTYKYLNSGNLIGRAKGMAALLSDVVARMKDVNEDDQLIMANAFLRQVESRTNKTSANPAYTITLDYQQHLFAPAWDTAMESKHFAQYGKNTVYYDRKYAHVVNTETHTLPTILHFNGDKSNLYVVARHFMRHHAKHPRYQEIKDVISDEYQWFKNTCEDIISKVLAGETVENTKPKHRGGGRAP